MLGQPVIALISATPNILKFACQRWNSNNEFLSELKHFGNNFLVMILLNIQQTATPSETFSAVSVMTLLFP